MPDILVQGEWGTYFPTDIEPDVTALRVDRAERTVVDRYRQDEPGPSTDVFDIVDGEPASVELDGWAETGDGTPDPSARDDGLLDALRDSIARLVEHRLTAADRNLASESRGGRSESYRGRGVSQRVYAPLRPYDDRTPWM
jgi:hypothetical protein